MNATAETLSPLPSPASPPDVHVAVVGAGFAGLGMAFRLLDEGVEDFVVLERADAVGGTWRDNTYPGCQCDVPSHLYSFSFAPNPDWSRTYSRQAEIQAYLNRCAQEPRVRSHLRLGCEVQEAAWDDDARLWRLTTSDGPLTARVLVGAMGGLVEPKVPDLPGLSSFAGALFHSARWDHDHDLTGERVAVIGTGASAIQLVPHVRRAAAQTHVFQRTPPWILPHTDRPITGLERRLHARVPALRRALRAGIFASREAVTIGLRHPTAMRGLEAVGRQHLRHQVRDPELRAKLTPHYRLGCKRILVSNRFYPALTKPDCELVTEAVTEIRPHAIVTADGRERPVDTLVLATGFHVTDATTPRRVRGREGRLLGDVWAGSPQAHRGTTVAGFPNLFLLVGPNTGTGSTSQVFMIEAQISYVMAALDTMAREALATVEVRREVQDAYNADIQARMEGTTWTSGCGSWYLDAEGRNTTLWPDFSYRFRRELRAFHPAEHRVTPAVPLPVPVAA